ncbi:MAG: efflux RND transporter periplasmic adaptor subunit [Verrucomicrobia bacterium]|jgi:RND family efflux transporter MFP subunit|nr:efflux RND transporter periplasmic adaptor subunit [Verrucomicrobiota bacterium]
MKTHDKTSFGPQSGLSLIATILVCAVIAIATAVVLFILFQTEPEAQRETAVRKTAMLVDVVTAEKGDYRPEIIGLGRVEPAREVQLSPRVDGEIVEVAKAFRPGSHVSKGEVLVRIDPADYEIALAQRQSELLQAEADLRLEQGRQEVARQEFDLLRRETPGINRALVLREPQRQTAEANVKAARAAVDRARLDLERTRVRAPFDGQILRRDVNLGSQIEASMPIGRLVGTEAYWIFTTIPLRHTHWILPSNGGGANGSEVRVRNRSAWPEGSFRKGRVDRIIGAVDEETRLARILVTVADPLVREGSGDLPVLTLGTIVQCRIEAREIPDAVRLARANLRADDTVWVMKDGKLEIREVEVVFEDARHAYVTAGLEDGERIVTTDLSTVREGAALRLAETMEGDS